VPTTKRERRVDAAPGQVWALVSNPHHQPRWWPRVVRVEGVGDGRFTQVLTTERGRQVRADFRVVGREEGRSLRWQQQLEGTPFASVFRSAETEIAVEPAGEGALVRITVVQTLAGLSKVGGGGMVKRGTRKILDEALDGLAAIV
jgi:carbon monoxide dehydrogenase subunit G